MFSSIVQSIVALVALLSVAVVFKYQSLSIREDRLLEELNKEKSDLAILGGQLTATSGDELLENIRARIPEESSDKDGFRTIKLRLIKEELESQNFVRSFLNEDIIKISLYIFFVALLNLLALMLVPFLVSVPFLATTSLYLVFFFMVDILRLIIKVIVATLTGFL